MKRLLLLALLVAGCTSTQIGDSRGVSYSHDAQHRVSCWTVYSASISCLPDKDVHLP